MTNAEAIETLKQLILQGTDERLKNDYEAIDLAIKTLESGMNNDLISREALKEKLTTTILAADTQYMFDEIMDIIDNAPTVEAFTKEDMAGAYNEGYACGSRENTRPQGEWIHIENENDNYETYKCPCCGKEITVDATKFCDIGFTIEDFKCCLNCGADMRGGVK